MNLPETDPMKLAALYAMQWMHENGFHATLSSLEAETKTTYDETKLTKASKLMHLVWRDMEEEIVDNDEDATARREREEEEEALLRGGRGDVASTLRNEIGLGIHPASITCVRSWPGSDEDRLILTGAGDGFVRLISTQEGTMPKIVWEMKAVEFGGGVLSIDVSSEDEGGGVHLIAVGTMSGDLVILRGKVDGEVERLASTKCHTKYLHCCIWACSHLASAGHDQSISVSKYHDGQIDLVRRIQFGFAVNDIAFHQPSNSLIVALKDSYSLRLIDLPGFLSGPGDEDEAALMLRCEKKVSLNEKEGDTHVSSSAKFLSLSSDGRFLGVCTDSTRVLVLRIEVGKDWRLSRTLFITSHQTDPFHTPSLAWHYDSNYLYIASGAGGGVQVLHLGSGKIFCTISAHEINVRDMTYDLERRELITCSFDKTVKVWGDKKKGNLHENLLSGATPVVLDNLSM